MISIYRISDNGYVKPKLPCATKMVCLKNFFCVHGPIDHLILDNCSEETTSSIESGGYARQIHKTKLGNAQSFLYAMDIAIGLDGPVYFVEDDYVHHGDISAAIADGLCLGDYCTLYDHPDKYSGMYGLGETCRVFRRNNRHWRTTTSTTMTFACMAETIRGDARIFRSVCEGRFHPNDHEIFQRLHSENGRSLVSCLPGMSMHADLTTCLSNIDTIGFEIDEGALDAVRCIAIDCIKAKRKNFDVVANDADGVKEKLVLAHQIDSIMRETTACSQA